MVFKDGKWVDEESQYTGQTVADGVKTTNVGWFPTVTPAPVAQPAPVTQPAPVAQPPSIAPIINDNYMSDVAQSLNQAGTENIASTGYKRWQTPEEKQQAEIDWIINDEKQKLLSGDSPIVTNPDGSGSFPDGTEFDSFHSDEYGNKVYMRNGQVVKTIGADSEIRGDQTPLMTPNQDRYTNQLIAQLDNIMPGLLSSYQGMIGNKIDNADEWGRTFDPTTGLDEFGNPNGDTKLAVDPARYSTGIIADYLGEWSGNNQNSYGMLGDQANFDAVDAADRRQYERDIADSRAMGGNELHSRGRIADERDISNAFADRTAYRNEDRSNRERALKSTALESMLNRSQQYYNDQGARQSDYYDKDARSDAMFQAQKAANVNSYNDMAMNSYIANQNNLMAGQQTDMGMMQGLANIIGMPTGFKPFENIVTPDSQSLMDSITGGGGIPGMIGDLFGL